MSEENNILNFQVERKLKYVARTALELLEQNHIYIKSLENVLIKMGINEEVYSNSEFQYNKDRKKVLDQLNNSLRELDEFVKSFDIKLKRD